MDTLTAHERSERMSRIRATETGPELAVKRIVKALGYGAAYHQRNLPGSPDLSFPSRRKAIFVHGCFWHRHPSTRCHLARLPKSRLAFWLPKLETNRARDRRNFRRLWRMRWRVLVIWECRMKNDVLLRDRIGKFLRK